MNNAKSLKNKTVLQIDVPWKKKLHILIIKWSKFLWETILERLQMMKAGVEEEGNTIKDFMNEKIMETQMQVDLWG